MVVLLRVCESWDRRLTTLTTLGGGGSLPLFFLSPSFPCVRKLGLTVAVLREIMLLSSPIRRPLQKQLKEWDSRGIAMIGG